MLLGTKLFYEILHNFNYFLFNSYFSLSVLYFTFKMYSPPYYVRHRTKYKRYHHPWIQHF